MLFSIYRTMCFKILANHVRMVLVLFLQAEAIRKILGQDSSRKKREDKIKKRLDELAQVLGKCTAINHLSVNELFLSDTECLEHMRCIAHRKKLHMKRGPRQATSEQ